MDYKMSNSNQSSDQNDLTSSVQNHLTYSTGSFKSEILNCRTSLMNDLNHTMYCRESQQILNNPNLTKLDEQNLINENSTEMSNVNSQSTENPNDQIKIPTENGPTCSVELNGGNLFKFTFFLKSFEIILIELFFHFRF